MHDNRITPFIRPEHADTAHETARDAGPPTIDPRRRDALLDDYLRADLPLPELASRHDLTVRQLLALLNSPEISGILNALERAAQNQARRVAALARPRALAALRDAVDADPALNRLLTPALHVRSRETTRSAAASLLRAAPADPTRRPPTRKTPTPRSPDEQRQQAPPLGVAVRNPVPVVERAHVPQQHLVQRTLPVLRRAIAEVRAAGQRLDPVHPAEIPREKRAVPTPLRAVDLGERRLAPGPRHGVRRLETSHEEVVPRADEVAAAPRGPAGRAPTRDLAGEMVEEQLQLAGDLRVRRRETPGASERILAGRTLAHDQTSGRAAAPLRAGSPAALAPDRMMRTRSGGTS